MSRPDPSNAPSPFLVAMAFAAVYLIWGSTYLGIRFATESIPPFLMAGTRSVTAGLLLYAVMRLRGAPRPSALHWRSAAIVGGLLLMGGNGGVTWSEQRIPSGLAALIIATVPMWMVMLDWLRPGGVRPHFRILIGLVMGLVGIILLVGPLGIAAYQQIDPLGVGVVILAAFLWSSGSIYARRAPLPSAQLLATAMEMLAGGTLLLILSLAVGEWGRFDPGAVSLKSILTLAYLIVFGSLIGFTAYVWLLRVSTPARASTYAYVNPVIAVFLGWLLADEPLNLRILLATAIIIGAVVLINTYRAKGSSLNQSEPTRRTSDLVRRSTSLGSK